MANPLEELSIFSISAPKGKDGDRLAYGWITVRYSKGGTAMAYYNYQKGSCASAGGYGYDKTGTALAGAIEKLTGVKIINGMSGVHAVVRDANGKGIQVKFFRDLLPNY